MAAFNLAHLLSLQTRRQTWQRSRSRVLGFGFGIRTCASPENDCSKVCGVYGAIANSGLSGGSCLRQRHPPSRTPAELQQAEKMARPAESFGVNLVLHLCTQAKAMKGGRFSEFGDLTSCLGYIYIYIYNRPTNILKE